MSEPCWLHRHLNHINRTVNKVIESVLSKNSKRQQPSPAGGRQSCVLTTKPCLEMVSVRCGISVTTNSHEGTRTKQNTKQERHVPNVTAFASCYLFQTRDQDGVVFPPALNYGDAFSVRRRGEPTDRRVIQINDLLWCRSV